MRMMARSMIWMGMVMAMMAFIAPLCMIGTGAGPGVAAAHGPEHHEGGGGGWVESVGRRVRSWMPWSDKLGHNWQETYDRVEHIYEQCHDEAQHKVEQLKESSLRGIPEVQKKIAEIYADAASKAEKEIEALKHPMLEWLTHWHKASPSAGDAAETAAEAATGAGVTGAAGRVASRVKHDIEALPGKLSHGYKSALEQAKSSMDAMGSSASGTWEEAKAKAAQAYSDAFHKGHGSTRTTLGSLRDALGRGLSGTKHMAEAAACKVWNMMLHSVMAVFWTALGAGGALWGLNFWSRRRFNKQLNSHISGPVVAVGEYMVIGDEAAQRKFYEFWSGPASTFFSQQPGLRKHWMHRGIKGAENSWLCYSEWDSIESLRRAHNNPEFAQIRKRAPKPAVKQMIIYQLGNIDSVDGPKEPGGTSSSSTQQQQQGLRQRTTTS